MKTFKASNSKVIDQVWYSPETRVLSVKTTDQNEVQGKCRKELRPRRYIYIGVPQTVFSKFARAKSKGKFFATNIRDKYLYQKDAFTL